MATATRHAGDVSTRYEPVIGLEVHAQLRTATKIFCSCRNRFGDAPNTNVCPVCLGLPGALPVLTRHAVSLALRAALATGCTVQETSIFARKNYFYPGPPQGLPDLAVRAAAGHPRRTSRSRPGRARFRRVRVDRIHMEEDAGKLLHEGHPWSAEKSGVDFNRSGVPLIEIVSAPDLHSAQEAHDYLTALKAVLLYAGVSDCNMEEGSLRCDANVSVRPVGTETLGTRAEIKNLNSFRNVARAIDHEIARQSALLAAGGRSCRRRASGTRTGARPSPCAPRKTRTTTATSRSRTCRRSSSAPAWLQDVRASLPELPAEKRRRFVAEYKLPEYDAGVLTLAPEVADYFETVARESGNAKAASNWVMTEVLRKLKDDDRPLAAAARCRRHGWPS